MQQIVRTNVQLEAVAGRALYRVPTIDRRLVDVRERAAHHSAGDAETGRHRGPLGETHRPAPRRLSAQVSRPQPPVVGHVVRIDPTGQIVRIGARERHLSGDLAGLGCLGKADVHAAFVAYIPDIGQCVPGHERHTRVDDVPVVVHVAVGWGTRCGRGADGDIASIHRIHHAVAGRIDCDEQAVHRGRAANRGVGHCQSDKAARVAIDLGLTEHRATIDIEQRVIVPPGPQLGVKRDRGHAGGSEHVPVQDVLWPIRLASVG